GWKDLLSRANGETSGEKTLADLVEATKNLVDENLKTNLQKYGHTICPDSKSIQRDLDIEVTLNSDCIVISTEISPAGIMTLISNCHSAVKNLLFREGLMCRGYITKGMIFHLGDDLIGTGYQKAHKMEQKGTNAFKLEANEMGTSFVEIDPVVCDYIKDNTDNCVNIKFERLVETDGEITAIFPFKSMDHDFLIGDFCGHKFDAGSERKSNNAVRSGINKTLNFLEKNTNHKKSDAVRKAEYYRRALKDQLVVCNDTDIFLNQLDNL
ncbi:MAG: hypothetical protein GY729_08760, partial [Desulfobacteraceae bacterium]|nr:hypothetical protein [Desulfobacteraceae bacterium]